MAERAHEYALWLAHTLSFFSAPQWGAFVLQETAEAARTCFFKTCRDSVRSATYRQKPTAMKGGRMARKKFEWIRRQAEKCALLERKAERARSDFSGLGYANELRKLSPKEISKRFGSPLAALAFLSAFHGHEKYDHKEFLKSFGKCKRKLDRLLAQSRLHAGEIVLRATQKLRWGKSAGWMFEYWKIPHEGFRVSLSKSGIVLGEREHFFGFEYGRFDRKLHARFLGRKWKYDPLLPGSFTDAYAEQSLGLHSWSEYPESDDRETDFLAIGDQAIAALYKSLLGERFRKSEMGIVEELALLETYATVLVRTGARSIWCNPSISLFDEASQSRITSAMKEYKKQ